MKTLRQLLLICLFCAGQLFAGAHAVEHVPDEGAEANVHACQLCLAGHNLGAALPAFPVAVLPIGGYLRPAVVNVQARISLPPPLPVQRGPPRP